MVDALAPADRAQRDLRAMEFFDAWLLLRRGDPDGATAALASNEFTGLVNCVWRAWYLSLREAAGRAAEWNPWSAP